MVLPAIHGYRQLRPQTFAATLDNPLALFVETYRRNRSEAYVLWALVRHWCAYPRTAPFVSRPSWLARRTNTLAQAVRDQLQRPAPIWPGNNTRWNWRNSPAQALCRRLACAQPSEVAALDRAICQFVLQEEPVLDPVSIPESVSADLLRRLLHQPTGGVFAQGVLYGLASVFYDAQGCHVHTKHVCAADRQSGAYGDIEVLRGEDLLLVIEVTATALKTLRIQRAAEAEHRTVLVARHVPQWLAARWQFHERVSCWTLDAYAEFLLAHLGPEDRRLALDRFANEFLRRLAGGAHYGLLRAILA